VETNNHDLKVLARKGYYAPRGEAAYRGEPAGGVPPELAPARAK
jgi:hypothetical protein